MKRIGALLQAGFFLFYGTIAFGGEHIAAKVNGAVITDGDVESEINALIPRATYHGNVTEEKRAEFREKALENLVNLELRYQDGLARGFKPDKKQVKAEVKKIRDGFKSQKEYQKTLERSGLTEASITARFEKWLVALEATRKVVIEPSKMNEEALKDYYQNNISKFKKPENIRLRIISSKTLSKAEEARSRIKAGDDFGDIAAAMSADAYRVKGGDLGYIHRGRIVPELEEAAFKLKVGEVSDIIPAEGEWYILKVEDKQLEHQMLFDEVKEKLKKDLEKEKYKELLEAWLTSLRVKAKIELFPPSEKQTQ